MSISIARCSRPSPTPSSVPSFLRNDHCWQHKRKLSIALLVSPVDAVAGSVFKEDGDKLIVHLGLSKLPIGERMRPQGLEQTTRLLVASQTNSVEFLPVVGRANLSGNRHATARRYGNNLRDRMLGILYAGLK
jgi:hypothetical protein